MFRAWRRFPLLPMALAELASFALAPPIAYWGIGRPFPDLLSVKVALYAGVFSLAMLAMGLYSRRQRAQFIGQLLRAIVALLAGSIVLGFFSYMVPELSVDRAVFFVAGPVALILVGVTRALGQRMLDDEIFRRRVLVFGAGKRASSIATLRRRADQRGFRIVGYVHADGDRLHVPPDRVMSCDPSLIGFAQQHRIDEILIANDDRRLAFPVHELLDCRVAGIEVTDLMTFLERETGKVWLDVMNPAWFIFSPGFRRNPLRRFSARALDISASVGLLALAWPVMLLTVLAIKLEDGLRAPVLYRQVRVGLEGRRFHVLKFRSMRVDAEKGGKAIWAASGDARVTRVGAFIRKVRIDELPQLLNVLVAEMAFVGPRPERPEFVEELEQSIPYYRERHSVKPGLTGWAQLCYSYGSSEADAAEKLQYDLYYVKNHSLVFDLVILLQTVEVILWGKGAR